MNESKSNIKSLLLHYNKVTVTFVLLFVPIFFEKFYIK